MKWPLLAVAVTVLTTTSAFAQSEFGARGYLTYGMTSFAAHRSLEAVGGPASPTGLGGGGTATGLWRGLFADVAVSQQKINGERVFIDNTRIYKLGTALRITTRPLDVAAGWRFVKGRISPFLGAGVSFISYTESSDFALAIDDVSQRAAGGVFLGGADISLVKWLFVGGEVRYRSVSGVLGEAGASEALGDNQLGGVSASLRISVGR
jgi:hypothetical protein